MIHRLIYSLTILIFTGFLTTSAAQTYFSITGLDYNALLDKYQETPLHSGTELETFVDQVGTVDTAGVPSLPDLRGSVRCQVFVDTRGLVESIFIQESVHPTVDSLAVSALFESQFKPLHQNGRRATYSCIVTYYYLNGRFLPPLVNEKATQPEVFDKIEKENVIVPFYALSREPEVIRRVPAKYPELAKKAGIEGTVVLKILVETDGVVEEVEVLKSHSLLDQAAIDAVRQFAFIPGEHQDKRVKVWLSIPFTFALK